jgi:peptidyl-prolyl cis-trans isomerase SurA
MTSRFLGLCGFLLLLFLSACAPVPVYDHPTMAPPDELLATWNDRVSIYRRDYESWLAWRGLEATPEHLVDFAARRVLAQLTRERGDHPALEQRVRERVLEEALLARIDATVQVDESRVGLAWAAAMEDDQRPRRYQLRNLFLALPQDAAEHPQIRTQMEALRKRALAGEEFASLATEYSQSQTRFREGRLGLIPLDRLPAAAAEAIKPLSAGDISAIVETGGGLSIFYCERIVEAQAADPDALKQRVRMQLQRQAVANARATFDQELLAKQGVTIEPPAAQLQLRELRVQRAVELGLDESTEIAEQIRWQTMQAQAQLEMSRQVDQRRGAADEDALREAFARMQSRGEGMIRYKVGGIALGAPTPERLAEARRLLAQIENGELPFEEAARRRSIDASSTSGGDLGWFTVRTLAARDWMMMRAIRNMAPGELSGLMHADDGLWVYRLLARQSGEQVRFEDVRSELEARLADSQTRALQNAIVAEISNELVLANDNDAAIQP